MYLGRISRCCFFGASLSTNPEIAKQHLDIWEEEVRSYIEMSPGENYVSVMSMPYKFFRESLQWKVQLEEAKRKNIEGGPGQGKQTTSGRNPLQNRFK